MLFLLFLLSFFPCLGNSQPLASKFVEKYIELSMDWVGLLKGLPEFDEGEIHSLAKDCAQHEESQKQLTKTYENYLRNKSSDYQKIFTEKVIIPRQTAVVTKRLEKLPGFYLTKVQIEKFRAVLLEKKLTGATVADTITALKSQLSEEIGMEKAERAIDMLLKDLQVIYKVHGSIVINVDPALGFLLHDEL